MHLLFFTYFKQLNLCANWCASNLHNATISWVTTQYNHHHCSLPPSKTALSQWWWCCHIIIFWCKYQTTDDNFYNRFKSKRDKFDHTISWVTKIQQPNGCGTRDLDDSTTSGHSIGQSVTHSVSWYFASTDRLQSNFIVWALVSCRSATHNLFTAILWMVWQPASGCFYSSLLIF